jgi:nucleotide-binding universal stress UspA family protein
MTPISKILVPVDFSERSQDATRYAAALACSFHSELTLLHVFIQPWAAYSSPEGYATPPPYDLDSTYQQVNDRLDDFLKDELQKFKVRHVVTCGEPANQIVDIAASEHYDLIVMPTHGYGPFRRFLLGSITAKVLHDAPCPVFTGPHLEHPPSREDPSFRKVLCALDTCQENRRVLEWAAGFARHFGSQVGIVHVLPESTRRAEGMYFDSQWRADLAESARVQLTFLKNELNVEGELIIRTGEIPEEVRIAAEKFEANVVVVGHGCSSGILGRLRANTYGIIRESGSPVVVV